MEIRRKIMINQRYMTVSPRGFNSESISPRGFNSLSVSPRGFNSFLILFMMAFCFSGFSQTEGRYDVIINKNSKITFTGFQLNKTQPYSGFKHYEVLAPIVNVAGANNGLTLNGQTVQLGGLLVQATNINQNGFNLTTTGLGNIGIGINTGLLAKMHVVSTTGNTALFKSNNGGGGYAVRGESVNIGVATGVYGELGVFDGTRWSGVRGNSGTSNMPAVTGFQTVSGGVSAYFNQRVGIGTTSPTSTLHTNGSVGETVTVITATTTLNETHNKILLQNGATAITITLPNALTCLGRKYEFSRYAGSTGGVTILPSGGQIQALNGTVGATTSIGAHSAAGLGLRHSFTAVNIGGVGVWVRL